MSRYLYISPVGTSLLRNFVLSSDYQALLTRYEEYQPRRWFRLSPDEPLNKAPSGFLCNPPSDIVDALREYVSRDPRHASAEINGIYSIMDLYYHDPREVEVLLIGTSTCNSMVCMNIVADYLKLDGFNIDKITLTALRSIDEFEEGIIELLDKVVPRIRRKIVSGGYVYINATPGFKPETNFLVLASILAGANSIIYIHEAFKKPVTLPIPPIMLDKDRIKEIAKLYEEDKCLDTSIVHEYLGSAVTQTYIDSGILRKTSDGTKICVRRWFSKLIEKYM